MSHYKLESLAEVAAVSSLPFLNPENEQNNYYQRPSDAGWFCADRAYVRKHRDIGAAFSEPLFQSGVARIESLLSEVTAPAPKSRRRKAYRTDQGDDLDMQRVWQGDLEHSWTRFRREASVGPSRVLIIVDVAASSCTSAKSMALRGVAALVLASCLQEAGYTVAISAVADVTMIDKDRTPFCTEVTVLAPGQEIDLHKLASMLASSLLFRGGLMDYSLRMSPNRVGTGVSYVKEGPSSNVIDTTGYDHTALIETFRHTEDARRWLETELKKLGGENA
jgi:hypothetical protein